MNWIRQNIVLRLVWGALAFQVFNVSIDAPDAKPDYIAEDLTVNDIETVVELVLEKVLDIENAIPEQDEPDEDGGGFSVKKQIQFFAYKTFVHFVPYVFVVLSQKTFIYSDKHFDLFHPELNPPPPKA